MRMILNKGAMKTKSIYFLIILLNFVYSQCPDELVEDDCGECWQPYCYCISDHTPNFDISQSECEEDGCWWIGPGGTYEPGDYEFCLFDPYWNESCTGCTEIDAENYDSDATISCDDNCNGETGDCCEYQLSNNLNLFERKLKIKNAYPNPFNPQTKIDIDVPDSGILQVNIYDISGKIVEKLHEKYITKGTYSFVWNPQNNQSGIYIIKVSMNKKTDAYFISLIK